MSSKRRQQGATLFIALIMLVVLTLFAVTAINLSNTNLRIAGNMQAKAEVEAAAQQAIEQVVSSDFTTNLAAVPPSIDIDINNDGTKDYTATIPTPVCLSSKPLLNSDLDTSIEADRKCLSSGAAPSGPVGPGGPKSTAQSWCYKQQWDVQARVTDSRTGASVNLHQGVFKRSPAGTTC